MNKMLAIGTLLAVALTINRNAAAEPTSIECVGSTTISEPRRSSSVVRFNVYIEFDVSPKPWAKLQNLPGEDGGTNYPSEDPVKRARFPAPVIRDSEIQLCMEKLDGSNLGCYVINRLNGTLEGRFHNSFFNGVSDDYIAHRVVANCSPATRRKVEPKKF